VDRVTTIRVQSKFSNNDTLPGVVIAGPADGIGLPGSREPLLAPEGSTRRMKTTTPKHKGHGTHSQGKGRILAASATGSGKKKRDAGMAGSSHSQKG
jgi:hypothetical protein